MRKRNQKKTLQAHALSGPGAFLVVVGSLLLGYVVMVSRSQAMGHELSALEKQRDALVKEYQQEQFKWTRMKSPENLERALREHGLSMQWPSSRQIVRLRARDVQGDWLGADEAQLAHLDRIRP